ncbi:MAG: transcription-repair coupling factor [Planctomycetota bacterium]
MSEPTVVSAVDTEPLVDARALAVLPEVARLAQLALKSRRASAGGLWGSSQALVLAALAQRMPGPWLVVTASEAEAEGFAADLATFGAPSTLLPARESVRPGESADDSGSIRDRLQVVQALAGPEERRPRLVVASTLSLLQPVPSRVDLARDLLTLSVNQHLDADEFLGRLVQSGYTRQPLAEKPGEVSLRGEILDVYPYASALPLRIELFGDEIESLRTFDPLDQRSIETVSTLQVCLARDAGDVEAGDGVLPASLFSPTATIVEVEPLRIQDRAEGLRIQSPSHARALMQWTKSASERPHIELQSLPGKDVTFDTRSVQALGVGIREAPRALSDATISGTRAVVVCQNAAEAHRFGVLLEEAGANERIAVRVGHIAKGFRMPALGLVLVNHRELIGIVGKRAVAAAQPAHKVRAIQSFFELRTGDYVVHAVHGVARFVGLKRMERSGGEEDHLHLVFAEDVSLYVPVSRIDHVQRYIGAGSAAPPLDKIGSQSFRKRKDKVERALYDLAAELLDVQARRALKKRTPWTGDPKLLEDMIGAFAYTETSDQVEVDREIAADLASDKPMDRLLCGDVGFGKTELAIRAAFRVVAGGGQVAVLVPTTVLAQQHAETFRERLADFPVEIGMLSRYVTDATSKETATRVANGQVDILIGTHRILSKDISFQRLGLVIVDEEQRFGVTHKEHFKKLRAHVDLLTLTATPIPRTLHMSLSGVRDISALTVAPPGRQEIETKLSYVEDDDLLREVIRREKNREGQVFFLHNRVESIVARARHLAQLAPECSFAIGHGQMGARELQHVMEAFIRGDVDVLVATTIIESGIDIPAAGTIIIDEADHFGLSELHQLRGRVGRGSRKAHCYLLIERTKPIREIARERLKALEEMTQLGAGFAISMKDLEIRGAGNILGAQQSGHIGAVGYDMYCKLLKLTVERIRAGGTLEDLAAAAEEEAGVDLELGLRAFLPQEWIGDDKTRLEVLRSLSEAHTETDVKHAGDALRDRFGRIPAEAESLLRMFTLKARLQPLTIERLAWRGESFLIEFTDRVALERGLDLRRVQLRPLRTGVAHLPIPEKITTAERALDWFEGLLHRSTDTPRIAASEHIG